MEFDFVDRCLNNHYSSTQPLTPSEEKVLMNRFRTGDEAARDRLIESNLRFVVKMAMKYRNQGVPLADLIQEGTLGLIEALGKFDESKQCRLVTYAGWWIRLYMQRATEQKNWMVNLPVNKMELLRKIRGFSKHYELTQGHEPSAEEIAEKFKMSVEKVKELFDYMPTCHSIHSQDEDSPGLEKVLIDETLKDVHQSMWDQEAAGVLKQAFKQLSLRERQVLIYRYTHHPKGGRLSLRKVGDQLGLSAEGVRRIESQALKKLRQPEILAQMANLFAA